MAAAEKSKYRHISAAVKAIATKFGSSTLLIIQTVKKFEIFKLQKIAMIAQQSFGPLSRNSAR